MDSPHTVASLNPTSVVTVRRQLVQVVGNDCTSRSVFPTWTGLHLFVLDNFRRLWGDRCWGPQAHHLAVDRSSRYVASRLLENVELQKSFFWICRKMTRCQKVIPGSALAGSAISSCISRKRRPGPRGCGKSNPESAVAGSQSQTIAQHLDHALIGDHPSGWRVPCRFAVDGRIPRSLLLPENGCSCPARFVCMSFLRFQEARGRQFIGSYPTCRQGLRGEVIYGASIDRTRCCHHPRIIMSRSAKAPRKVGMRLEASILRSCRG